VPRAEWGFEGDQGAGKRGGFGAGQAGRCRGPPRPGGVEIAAMVSSSRKCFPVQTRLQVAFKRNNATQSRVYLPRGQRGRRRGTAVSTGTVCRLTPDVVPPGGNAPAEEGGRSGNDGMPRRDKSPRAGTDRAGASCCASSCSLRNAMWSYAALPAVPPG